MRILISCLLTFFGMSPVIYANTTYKPACQGTIHLSSESCGIKITIGNSIVGSCLDKSSLPFSTFYSQCLKNRSENLELNADHGIDGYQLFNNQCGGTLVFLEGAPCGTHFVLLSTGAPPSEGGYQSVCHDPNGTSDELMKDIRNFCEIKTP